MEKSDDELIALYQNGDTKQIETLINRYANSVYRFVFRMSPDKNIVEDITQETFIKIWKSLPNYKMTNSFKALVFTIARNTALDHFRKKKIPVFSQFDDNEGNNTILDTLGDPEAIPEILLMKAEERGVITAALETLPPADREILTLHYEQDLTFDAIGKITNTPLNTVKSKHRRALIKLRELLEHSP